MTVGHPLASVPLRPAFEAPPQRRQPPYLRLPEAFRRAPTRPTTRPMTTESLAPQVLGRLAAPLGGVLPQRQTLWLGQCARNRMQRKCFPIGAEGARRQDHSWLGPSRDTECVAS